MSEEKKMKNTEIIDKRILRGLQMLMDNGEGGKALISFTADIPDVECPAIFITVEDVFSLIQRLEREKQSLTEKVVKEALTKVLGFCADDEVGMKYLIKRTAKEYGVEL